MLKGYKTEILPCERQALKIRQTLGTCRYLYNLYLANNFEVYETLGSGFFVTAFTFDKYVNHVVKKELTWIDECGAKARKQALMNAERAFKNYMEGRTHLPRFKKKHEQKVKAYFPKNAKGDWTVWRHKLQIPTIGIVRLKEKGYLPTRAKIRSGTISYKAGRYYVSVLVEVPDNHSSKLHVEGLGIDLGIKELAVMSNGVIKPNINKTPRVKFLTRACW
ncbi:MAG: transposase [Selenomonadaceae bacterium]|nr:transposase [Selenomonadaceae bacterium]